MKLKMLKKVLAAFCAATMMATATVSNAGALTVTQKVRDKHGHMVDGHINNTTYYINSIIGKTGRIAGILEDNNIKSMCYRIAEKASKIAGIENVNDYNLLKNLELEMQKINNHLLNLETAITNNRDNASEAGDRMEYLNHILDELNRVHMQNVEMIGLKKVVEKKEAEFNEKVAEYISIVHFVDFRHKSTIERAVNEAEKSLESLDSTGLNLANLSEAILALRNAIGLLSTGITMGRNNQYIRIHGKERVEQKKAELKEKLDAYRSMLSFIDPIYRELIEKAVDEAEKSLLKSLDSAGNLSEAISALDNAIRRLSNGITMGRNIQNKREIIDELNKNNNIFRLNNSNINDIILWNRKKVRENIEYLYKLINELKSDENLGDPIKMLLNNGDRRNLKKIMKDFIYTFDYALYSLFEGTTIGKHIKQQGLGVNAPVVYMGNNKKLHNIYTSFNEISDKYLTDGGINKEKNPNDIKKFKEEVEQLATKAINNVDLVLYDLIQNKGLKS